MSAGVRFPRQPGVSFQVDRGVEVAVDTDVAQMLLGIPRPVAYGALSGAQAWSMAALEPTRLKRMS